MTDDHGTSQPAVSAFAVIKERNSIYGQPPQQTWAPPSPHPLEKFGIKPLEHRGGTVTNEMIDWLREGGPY